MATQVLRIQKAQQEHVFPCKCCNDIKNCTHLDWDLDGYVCPDCAAALIAAEIQLLAWLNADGRQFAQAAKINRYHYKWHKRHWNTKPAKP